jgi:hypothetical protein
MDISVTKLLDKIGAELSEAKRAGSEAKIRERAQAIKALCELFLDESPVGKRAETKVIQPVQQSIIPQSAPQVMPQQQERMVMEDEANGESIFDF